jgi:hypothetical protein
MTTDQYGQLGLDTQNAVNASMASGKSLSQAMTDVGVAQGVSNYRYSKPLQLTLTHKTR